MEQDRAESKAESTQRGDPRAWAEELDGVLARLRCGVAEGISDAEVESDALDAIHEARRQIRARRR